MGIFTKKMADWNLIDLLKFTGLAVGVGYLGIRYLEKKEDSAISEDNFDDDIATAPQEDSE